MVVIAFYYLVQPLLKGSKGLSVHPKYLFGSYGNDLVFFWLSLGVAGLQDPCRTLPGFEKKVWQHPVRAKAVISITLVCAAIFLLVLIPKIRTY